MEIKTTLKDAGKAALFLAAIKKQMPYALSLALTNTARAAEQKIKEAIPKTFDNPTPWTINSTRVQPARKTKLQALIAVKDQAARGNPALFWIAPEVYGGNRGDKRAELALKTAGPLAAGRQTAPGKEAKLNRFGNLTKGTVKKALAGAKAAEAGQHQDGRTKYFVMRKGSQPIGIAARFSKNRMGMVLAFVRTNRYQKRLDFHGIGHKAVQAVYEGELNKAIQHALDTSK